MFQQVTVLGGLSIHCNIFLSTSSSMLQVYCNLFIISIKPSPPHSASCKMCLCVCVTLVNLWLVEEKPPPVQLAVGSGSIASHLGTLVNALVDTRKTPSVQFVGGCSASASVVFALIDTTSVSCRGSRPSWEVVGAGCSNQLR